MEKVSLLLLLKISIVGIPKLYWFGEEGGYLILIIELLSDSIEDIFSKKCKRHFSLMTTMLLAD